MDPSNTGNPSSYRLQHASPLTTLLRSTSSRKVNTTAPEVVISTESADSDGQYYYAAQQESPPASPLLHSRFARASIATASTGQGDSDSFVSSYYAQDDSDYQDTDFDQESVYTDHPRDSWQSSGTARAQRKSEQVIIDPGYPRRAPVTASNHPRTNGGFLSPALPPDSRKRAVLERNARRAAEASQGRPPARSNLSSSYNGTSNLSTRPDFPPVSASYHDHSPSPPPPQSIAVSGSAPTNQRPPSPPTSLYSQYSYYPMDSAAPSPTRESHTPVPMSRTRVNPQLSSQSLAQTPVITPSPAAIAPTASVGPTPEELLQEGITHHEANRLRQSYVCFERSAREGGGCGVGMLMYGLSLRHGWGCDKNEKTGFKWLHRAAESAMVDLDSARLGGEFDLKAVKSELVLAIYEVGQCFFHGWGIAKNKTTAVSYYSLAARLGDMDAQTDLAFALLHGKGCKKDRKEAAMWYRKAVDQGASDVGLAWIHKPEFL